MFTPNHAQQRCKERMGLEINHYDEIEMIMLIRKGKNVSFQGYSGNREREIWQVYYMDKVFRVVYDPYILTGLITVLEAPRRHELTPDMLNIVRQNRKRGYFVAAA